MALMMEEILNKWQEIYHKQIDKFGYSVDTEQLLIVEQFARIEQELTKTPTSKEKPSGFFSRFLKSADENNGNNQINKGLYLFGDVGRGKTFLMDMFCENISFAVKRLHFHNFMKDIHDELKTIKDKENPLTIIAKNFSDKYQILCLDEFMVTDITDAMILYGLLKSLIDNGVLLITTTNIAPDDLYKDGLQRARFLPAIDLLKTHCIIHKVADGQDFRRVCLERHKKFFSPLNSDTEKELWEITNELSENLYLEKNATIEINQRKIPFVAKSSKIIWFSFVDICEGFRSQMDYIELAKQFNVMIVSDIPVLDEFKEDAARRFLLLIDELYDKRINLILSSEQPIEEIYKGKKISFEFERLQSRLFEMQSKNYGKDI